MAETDWVILELNEALKRWRQGAIPAMKIPLVWLLAINRFYQNQRFLPADAEGRPPPLFLNFSFSYVSTSTKIQISPFADSLANLTIDPIPSTEPDFEDLFFPITGDSIP